MTTFKAFNVEQKSEQWLELRSRIFTASEIGGFLVAEKPTKVQQQARTKLIRKKLELFLEEGKSIADEENRKLGFNLDVARGNRLEPAARKAYEKASGSIVTEIGLCVHESSFFGTDGTPLSGFGCSPDGLIAGDDDQWERGLELKCPRPSTLMGWLDDACLPDEHAAQVHMSMAVTGLRHWDFFAYCPQMPSLFVRVDWDANTDRYLSELKKLHADFIKYRADLGKIQIKRVNLEPSLA